MTNVRYNGKLKNVVVFNDKKNDIRNWLTELDAICPDAELQLQQAHSKNNGQCSTFRKPLLTAAEKNEYTSNRFLTRIDSAAIREWMKQSWEVFVNSTIWLLLVVMAILMWAATSLLYKAGVHGDKEEYGMVFL